MSVNPLRALCDEDRQFRLLVESVEDYAIFMLDPEGRLTTWNVGAEDLRLRRRGNPRPEFAQLYPPAEVANGLIDFMLKSAATDGRQWREGWCVRKGGVHFWAEQVLTAVRDDREQLLGYSKVTRDVTRRKQAEEERAGLLAREQQARAEAEAASRARTSSSRS